MENGEENALKGDVKNRLLGMLDSEREEMTEQTKRVCLADFHHLIEEYFECAEEENVCLERNGNSLYVCFRARVSRVKNFSQMK